MRPAGAAQQIAATSRTVGTLAAPGGAAHDQPSRPRAAARLPRRLVGWVAWGLGGLFGLVFILAGAGFTYQTIATQQDTAAYPPPGQLVDVGGHRLHIQCVGAGSPTVIAESGLGGTSLDWSLVQPAVAQTTRICTYDRAGFGWSEPGPSPRTSGRIVEELHSLLAAADIAGPYVLVGHSVGGLHAQFFASRYAPEVAGLVLLDPTPAAYLASLEPAAQRDAAPPMEQLRMLQLMQPIGLTRLLGLTPPMPLQNFSPEQQRQLKAVSFKPALSSALYEEAAAYQVDLAEALDAAPLRPNIPLVVLVRGLVEGPADQDAAGKAANTALARRSTRGQLVIAERSHHYIQLDRPDLVIDAIEQLVKSVRTEGAQQ
jgi:pimeloyl-ACP methyl ester carboxylesterase